MPRHDFRLVPDPGRASSSHAEYLCSCGQWFSLKDHSDAVYIEALTLHRRESVATEGAHP